MRVNIALFILAAILVNNAACDCTFPSALSGAWYSSAKGLLNITTTGTLTTINAYSTVKFGNLDLHCNSSSGNYYIFQSDAFTYLGLNFRVYTCFYLANAVSTSKYIYYLGSVENTDASNERLKTPLVSIGYDPSVSNVCDRTSYAAGTEHVFLKNDGLEADSRTAFPFDTRGTWTYNFTSSSTTTCGGNSSADICTSADTSTVTFDYTLCSTVQAYSATGVLYCMWYSSEGNNTYIHVYNTDTSTDGSTTYRFTCYVVYVSGTTMYASQYPQSCQTSQTPTSAASPGATVVFTQTASCPYDTSSTVISTASAVGITVGVFFIVVIAVCAALIWYYYKKRKKREALDKLPLQKAQPANKRLTNGHLFRDSKSRTSRLRDSKTPAAMNGDVKINMDTDPSIRRENSICISVTTSRGGSGTGLEEKIGPAPVEEPDKLTKSAAKAEGGAPGDKYLVDHKRDVRVRTADKRAVQASSGDQHHRRRFGDPVPESARAGRKRTPRIRHPMEVQENTEEKDEKGEGLQKTEDFWRDEKLRRSGRSRKHPEARTIPSVQEDVFDYKDRPPNAPTGPPERGTKSAVGPGGLERENSAFIELGGETDSDAVWNKASNMWHFKNQPVWGNLAYQK